MAIQVSGFGGTVADIGGTTFRALHTHVKPLEYGALGHYRTAIKLTMATSQNANSRLYEVRNTHATNLLVLTRLFMQAGAGGTINASYMGEWGLWRLTGFSAVDSSNTVTPTSSVKRTTGMAAYPGTSAAIRHVTASGVAGGMTGGTLTKDGNTLATMISPIITVAAGTGAQFREMAEDMNGTHPLVCVQNEGWLIENIVAGSGTNNVVHVMIDCAWADVTAY